MTARGVFSLVANSMRRQLKTAYRIIMMKKGRIVAAGDPYSVITEENIASVYRVEAAVRSLSDRPMIMPLRQIREARA